MAKKITTVSTLREFIGLSQQELAELLVVSRAYVGMLETGRRDIPSSLFSAKIDAIESAIARYELGLGHQPKTEERPEQAIKKISIVNEEILLIEKKISDLQKRLDLMPDNSARIRKRIDILKDLKIPARVNKTEQGIMEKWIEWQIAKDQIKLRDLDSGERMSCEAKLAGLRAELEYYKALL